MIGRFYWVLLLLLAVSDSQAQCAFNNQFHSTITLSGNETSTVQCVYGGEFVAMSVTSGESYQLSTCNSSQGGDTQLTLFDSSNTGVFIDYNDDDCGVFSSINYTATFTGTLYSQINEFNCTVSSTCYTLDATCTSCDEEVPIFINGFESLTSGVNQ